MSDVKLRTSRKPLREGFGARDELNTVDNPFPNSQETYFWLQVLFGIKDLSPLDRVWWLITCRLKRRAACQNCSLFLHVSIYRIIEWHFCISLRAISSMCSAIETGRPPASWFASRKIPQEDPSLAVLVNSRRGSLPPPELGGRGCALQPARPSLPLSSSSPHPRVISNSHTVVKSRP